MASSNRTLNANMAAKRNALLQTEVMPPSEDIFLLWQKFIEAQVGFVLPKNQTHWLWHALNRLAEQEKLSYNDLLMRAFADEQFKQQIIDTVLIPQSLFFRHQASLDYLLTTLTQMPTASTNVKYPYQIWSAGCSYGQEVWSIALMLQYNQCNFEVWGSDVNESALQHAKQARYDLKQLNEVPAQYHQYIIKNTKDWQIRPSIQQKVEFFKYNLFKHEALDLPKMHVILCQNVLMYFRQFDQRDILNRLVTYLRVGGVLILAPGEVNQWHHPCMKKDSDNTVSAWQKTAEC